MVKVQLYGANYNLGDYVFGQPATTATDGTTKYSYRELLLCGGYGNKNLCGIACLNTHYGLALGHWNCLRSFLVNSKQLNTNEQ